eukprot:CAMPEP_0114137964 /NCGR_PEP_ID=MMETSP0043_2-20121206/16054_1 /TAXON_ID=464988 /ORGANISM="Hemiselmis andersenii, Strain CCMP644" /LENGTH=387 /DNA_ID=CAMNT_0001231871 /DNA_START=93 /DNA_END=1253 /DNA_ORIENTATION=-
MEETSTGTRVLRPSPEVPEEQMVQKLTAPDPELDGGGGGGPSVADEGDDLLDGESQHPSSNILLLSRVGLVCTYACVFGTGGWILYYLMQQHSERHVFAWAVAGIFVCLAVPLSLHDIHMHLLHYVSPLQKYYVRILWMVPIYAIESWLALRFKDQKIYLETAREAYEYSFYKLMLTFIGRDEAEAQRTIDSLGRSHAHMMFPLCKVEPWRLQGGQFLRVTGLGVFQYVWVRTFFAVVGLVAEWTGNMGEGKLQWDKLELWELIIVNASQSWALYCLVMFYHELVVPLADIRPFFKFVSIKCVIFLSFWQGAFISLAAHFDLVQETEMYTEEDIEKGLQDFLICVEMALAAMIHRSAFSHRDFARGGPLMTHLRAVGAQRRSAKVAM